MPQLEQYQIDPTKVDRQFLTELSHDYGRNGTAVAALTGIIDTLAEIYQATTSALPAENKWADFQKKLLGQNNPLAQSLKEKYSWDLTNPFVSRTFRVRSELLIIRSKTILSDEARLQWRQLFEEYKGGTTVWVDNIYLPLNGSAVSFPQTQIIEMEPDGDSNGKSKTRKAIVSEFAFPFSDRWECKQFDEKGSGIVNQEQPPASQLEEFFSAFKSGKLVIEPKVLNSRRAFVYDLRYPYVIVMPS